METQELLDKPIGTKERVSLTEADVKILRVYFKTDKKDGTKMKTPILVLVCNHPATEEALEITKAKVNWGDKLTVSALWGNVDSEGNIQKGSAIASLMYQAEAKTIKELEGKEIKLIHQSKDNHYLCALAY